MSRGFSNFDLITSILAGTATIAVTVISQQANAIAKTTKEIAQIAQTTTVQINNSLGDPGGTGVIVAKQGNTYTVLTANHVVRSTDAQYTIVTHKEKQYQVSNVQRLQTSKEDPDLAIVTFSSPDEYPVAPIADSDQAVIGADIFVCGYPLPSIGAGKERDFTFSPGIVSSRPKTRPQGYTLRYNAITRVGMSGGPVFDIQGRVVGIHGQADIDDSVAGDSGKTVSIKTGFNAGIPINIFVTLKSQRAVGVEVAVDKTPTGDNPTARLSNPQTAKDYYARAITRYDKDDFKGALEDYNQALRLDPNFADAYSKRAVAKLRIIGDSDIEFSLPENRGAIQEAIADFNKAVQLNPKDAFAYSYRGYARSFLGEKKAAMEDVTQALRIDPNQADAYNMRGLFRSDVDDYQGAIADFNEAIRLNPDLFYAYGNRSLAYYNQENYQKAIEDINRAIQIKPNNASVYLIRGMIRFQQEDYQGAMEDLNKSLELNPNNYASYFLRGGIRIKKEDFQTGLADLNQALKINPNFADAYFLRGTVRYSQKDIPGAMEDYDRAIKLKPNYADAYANRGALRLGQGDLPGALADSNQALKIDPKNADAYILRATIRTKQKDNPGAIEDINKALSIAPENADAYELRAGIRLEQGDSKGAIEDIDRVLKIKPNYADAYVGRGAARYQLGDKQGALADFQKGAELYQQQGNTQSYQQAQELITKLKQEL